MIYEELIDKDKLLQIQDGYCRVAGLVASCYSSSGERLTELTGAPDQLTKILPVLTEQIREAMFERIEDGSLEELAVEVFPGEEDIRVAAMAVKTSEDVSMLYWLIAQTADQDERIFYESLDVIKNTCTSIVDAKAGYMTMEAENRRNLYTSQEMSRDLKDIEATTEIVQLLDNDDAIEVVMQKWLELLSIYLRVDTAQIFQLRPDGKHMDLLNEWNGPGQVPYFDKKTMLIANPWLTANTKVVVSSDNQQSDISSDIAKYGLKAMMAFPIIAPKGDDTMVVSLNYRLAPHVWSANEIKFTADAVKVMRSIITRRIQKISIASSYAVLEAMLDNVGCSIFVTKCDSNEMLFANKRMKAVFAKEIADGSIYSLIKDIEVDDTGVASSKEFFHEDGERWYDLVSKEIPWIDEKKAILYSFYEITDKKLYQRRIEQQAYTDFLTGLYNRMCCERDLGREVDQAKKNGVTGAILYLDLDDFKHINDGLGHQYGDVLLKSISHALQSISGIKNTCYRMGGDEFVIIIPTSEYKRYDQIISDIKAVFAKAWFIKDADYYCTMSMGIVTFPDSGDSVADLIKKADIAMYEAKKSGKNRVAVYRDGIDSASGRRLDMERNMRDATIDGYKEFEVFYQPIINVENGGKECAGAEALIRWNSEKLGFISPAEFIPLAEYLGLINPIGNFVLKEACTRCKYWNDHGHPHYKVNVNLSVVQLLQNDIVDIVESTIRETGITPENLTLEVTESLAINDMERMKKILSNIKALGVKIALDDFGTGYSSLNHIREIPFDVIKVDQSFVKELADDAYSQSFIKMIAELGETIGVSICVEGIETLPQYTVLKGMKVKYIQGYYFDRPMRKTDFEEKYV